MKNLRKNKRGISLIVLVITIIVMIILAAAIILSLSNSEIISKANKAKTDSDMANLKEYVNTLMAEWELMTEPERIASGSATFEDYANEKLEEDGYKQRLSEDGILMNETSTAAVKAGIKIGDVVNYSTLLTEKSYTTDGSERSLTGVADETKKQTVKTNTSYTWKYIGISENGNLLIAPDLPEGTINSEYKIEFEGEGVAYSKGPEILNTICDALYTVEGKGTARSMNVDDEKLIEDKRSKTKKKRWFQIL